MQEERDALKQNVSDIVSDDHGQVVPDIPKTNISLQHTVDKPCACGKEGCSCNSESGEMKGHSFIYAIGKVGYHFPNKSLQLELAQAAGRRLEEQTKGMAREEVISKVLSDPENRYIARQVCYVLSVEKLETYILVPTDPMDIDKLAKAVRQAPDEADLDVVIGTRGSIAPPEMCNGLMLPIVYVDQIYSFDKDALMKSVPRQKGMNEDQFKKTFGSVFDHIVQIADNVGAIDEHRAINYLTVRYEQIYHRTQSMQDEKYLFTAIEVRPSRLSGVRKIVDVIFTYENLGAALGAVRKWFVRVDVTEEFPFLVTPMQEYFER